MSDETPFSIDPADFAHLRHCLFCHQELGPARRLVGHDNPRNPPSEEMDPAKCLKCDPCQATYHLAAPQVVRLDHQSYSLYFFLHLKCFGLLDFDSNLILKLKCLPKITPQNIAQKLPTLLTFL